MTTKHWIFLSAAPLSGKDTLSNMLNYKADKRLNYSLHLKLSRPLKSALKAFFGLSDTEYQYFETPVNKSTLHDRLNGLSWRQAQIDLAEKLVKPHWGRETFCKILKSEAESDLIDTGMFYSHVETIVVSDLGFEFERDWLLNNLEYKSITIVNIQRDGCSYQGDSRELVAFKAEHFHRYRNIQNIFINNNGTPQQMLANFLDQYYPPHNNGLVDTLNKNS